MLWIDPGMLSASWNNKREGRFSREPITHAWRCARRRLSRQRFSGIGDDAVAARERNSVTLGGWRVDGLGLHRQ